MSSAIRRQSLQLIRHIIHHNSNVILRLFLNPFSSSLSSLLFTFITTSFVCLCSAFYCPNIFADPKSPPTTSPSANSSVESSKTLAISQIVEHPALNAVREGLMASLKKQGFVEGENLKVLYENAQGNVAVSSQIAGKLLSLPIDVAVSISTPSTQSLYYTAKRLDKKVPIVFTAVSDAAALNLDKQYPITGVTDAPHLEGLLEVIEVMMPNIKALGLMYNPSEANSVSTITRLKKLLKTKGIEAHEVTVNNTNEVQQATQSLVGKVDALYFPQDNTVVAAIESVIKVAQQSSPTLPVILPIFTSDPILVKRGVLAAVGFDYFDIGQETGDVVAEILRGKAANQIAVENPKNLKTVVNKLLAEKLKLKIPEKLKYSTLQILE